jgi:cholesterol transport system auxiliary component
VEQQFFSSNRVRVALRALLVDVKRQIVIDGRDFEVYETASSEDAYGGVRAANRASAGLLGEMARWVITTMNENTKRIE